MIRVKFRFGTANRKEMSWMSETSALMDTLRQEGISPNLLRAVEEYRTAHPLAEALRPRIPSPAFVYYSRGVWEQALAALLCGENLLLAGGKATGRQLLEGRTRDDSVLRIACGRIVNPPANAAFILFHGFVV